MKGRHRTRWCDIKRKTTFQVYELLSDIMDVPSNDQQYRILSSALSLPWTLQCDTTQLQLLCPCSLLSAELYVQRYLEESIFHTVFRVTFRIFLSDPDNLNFKVSVSCPVYVFINLYLLIDQCYEAVLHLPEQYCLKFM